MKKIRILLVDDHFVVRLGLASSLNIEPGIEVVAEAECGAEVIELYSKHDPDLVLMDWRLPDATGGEVIQSLRHFYPDARVLVISAFESEEIVFQTARSGAIGYLPKSTRRPELIQAVMSAASGKSVFAPNIAAKLVARLNHPELTPREIEVMAELVRGNSNKEIANHLSISENTVKLHISHIMQKLGAKDRTHAASIALQRGLVEG
jgi:two-component system NarL family response regulator